MSMNLFYLIFGAGFICGLLVGANNAALVTKVRKAVQSFVFGLKVTKQLGIEMSKLLERAKQAVMEQENPKKA